MKANRRQADGKNNRPAHSKQARKTTGLNKSDRAYIDVELPASMAAAMDEAAREEFIYNAVREKVARVERVQVNPALELEDAHAQSDALMFLLSEFVMNGDDGLELPGLTKTGLAGLRAHVTNRLAETLEMVMQFGQTTPGGVR